MSPLVPPGELRLVPAAGVVPGVGVGRSVVLRVLPFLGVLLLLLRVLPFLGVLLLLRVLPFLGVLLLHRVPPFLGVLLLPVVVLRVVRDFRYLRRVVSLERDLVVGSLPRVVRRRLVVGRFRLGVRVLPGVVRFRPVGFLRPTVGFRGLGPLFQAGGRCFCFRGIPRFLGDLPVVGML
jgi:hypothetical protein